MSNKHRDRKAEVEPPSGRPARRARLTFALLAACALLTVGYAATRFEPVRRAVGMRPLLAPAATTQQGGPPLAKEYVYGGGRIIATEEPTPLPTGPAPTSLSATATSASSVSLTWAAPAAGVVVGYVVERTSALGGQPVEVQTNSAATSFNDSTPAGDFAYLYRVKALYAAGPSGYSNADLATTVVFTDDPLQPSATLVKAAHVTELRRAVAAVRALAGAGAASWLSGPAPAQGGAILAAHFQELRTNLNPALVALGMAALPDDTTLALSLPVKQAHLQDVRERVR
ncbi:MAG TPA: fibronectin type III domain-containing protein [Pyrinomonadaceae bacterium]